MADSVGDGSVDEPRPSETAAAPRPPLVRRTDDGLVAGVAAGISEHLDVPVVGVRIALALLVGSGIGILAYIALWILVPAAADSGHVGRLASGVPRRRRVWQLMGYIVVGSAASALLGAAGRPFGGDVIGPLVLAGIGALLIWRRAPDVQRMQWAADARRTGQRLVRFSSLWLPLAGTVLVVAGVTAFLAGHDALAQARAGALAILATLAGVALVAGPWLLRLVRDLSAERRARIRAQERAAVAAHVHDSVLQTLALLQARAGDPTAVRRLARRQERDLRDWLYGPDRAAGAVSPTTTGPVTLGSELRRVAADIEDDTGVSIEVVVVGAADVDERLRTVVAAAREAVLNAAKSSGAPEVALYAEVEPAQVGVWVRDRGVGFEPDSVGPDRHGIRDSIHARMAAIGGHSRVRSAPGNGTEVELILPRPRTASEQSS